MSAPISSFDFSSFVSQNLNHFLLAIRKKKLSPDELYGALRDNDSDLKALHYQYLTPLIKDQLPHYLHLDTNKETKLLKVIEKLQDNSSFKNFLSAVIDFHLELFSCIGDEAALQIASIKNHNEKVNKVTEFLTRCSLHQGLSTALEFVASIASKIPKLITAKTPDERVTKDNFLKCLNSSGTKKTLLLMMKKLHSFELGQVALILNIINCVKPSFEIFKLNDNDELVFDDSRISVTSRSKEDGRKTGVLQKSMFDASRVGCPASFEDLDKVINYVSDIINLIPDDKFSQWMQAV